MQTIDDHGSVLSKHSKIRQISAQLKSVIVGNVNRELDSTFIDFELSTEKEDKSAKTT